MTTRAILEEANAAKYTLAALDTAAKNRALSCIADAIEASAEVILEANSQDMESAKDILAKSMFDRLLLTKDRISAMAGGVRDVAALPDPVGRILDQRTTPDGLQLSKTAIPIGVVAIIYESRPNVTSDAAALCLKSGNACILRCGKDAHRSACAIVQAMRRGLAGAGLPEQCVSILEDTSRSGAMELMKANGLIDLLIPRGGAGLIRACVDNATVPCIETGTGICTVYVDGEADMAKAIAIVDNAKTQRPSVCNAAETCLVDRRIASAFLPILKQRLVDDRAAAGKQPVELRLCPESLRSIPGTPATQADFDTEFLDYVLAVKVVDGVEEAVRHIRAHSTHHSEAIITENVQTARFFTRGLDSAVVYVNASTRFTDGGRFGLGCEMGISTQKLHARGPMGLEELTSYTYIVTGNGQIREA